MSRYPRNYPRSDQPLQDGDGAFVRFASRRQSTVLPPGYLELSVNMQLDRTTAKVRPAITPAVTDITLTNPPVVLDFLLGADVAVTSITRAGAVATVTTTAPHGWATGNQVNIRAAVQPEYNGDKTITVTGANIFTFAVAGAPATPATGVIIANKGPVIFEDYASSVRASCMFATRNTDRTEYAILATTTQAYAVRPGAASQGILYPANETIESTDDCSMIYWNGRVFLFRGYQTAAALVISGITQAAGLATCTTAAAHLLATGDWAYIEEVIPYGYGGIVQLTVTGANTFTYAVNAGLASPATVTAAASKVRKCKRPLYWDGTFGNAFVAVTTGPVGTGGTYIHLPPVPWAIDIHNRLLIPWRADQLLLSDPYDSDTYDTIYEQFRLRYGSYDKMVAAVPAPGSVVFALCRRSLHRLILDEQNLAIGEAEEITRDIGCIARRTVRSKGDITLWLGDKAIHRVRLTDQLNLVPEALPLSDDVQDIIDSVNWTQAHKATAIIWNNRYYLALPIGADTLNTVVLVYNFINEGWESKHTYPAGFDVEEWHLMDSGGEKKLFASTTYGFLYDMASATATADSWGNTSSQQSYTINGSFDTRYYTGGTPEVKRCRRMFLEANLDLGDAFTAQVITRNPDHEGDLVTISAAAADDGRYPIYGGLSGAGAKLRVTVTAGRPEFRAVECEFTGVRERHNNPQT